VNIIYTRNKFQMKEVAEEETS